eukprot:c7994_g1_i1 orf=204-428(+)
MDQFKRRWYESISLSFAYSQLLFYFMLDHSCKTCMKKMKFSHKWKVLIHVDSKNQDHRAISIMKVNTSKSLDED